MAIYMREIIRIFFVIFFDLIRVANGIDAVTRRVGLMVDGCKIQT